MNKILKSVVFAIFSTMAMSCFAVTTSLKSMVKLEGMCTLKTNAVPFGQLTAGQTNSRRDFTVDVFCSRDLGYSLVLHYPEFTEGQGSRLLGVNKKERLPYSIFNVTNGLYVEAAGMYSNGVTSKGTGLTQQHPFTAVIHTVPYVAQDDYVGNVEVRLTY